MAEPFLERASLLLIYSLTYPARASEATSLK
jgi:hypothetical protein